MDEKTPYVHVWTECDVVSKPATGRARENFIEKRKTGVKRAKPAEWKMTWAKITTIGELTVKQKKDAYLSRGCDASRNNEWKMHLKHQGRLVR